VPLFTSGGLGLVTLVLLGLKNLVLFTSLLPIAKPTVLKQWRQVTVNNVQFTCQLRQCV